MHVVQFEEVSSAEVEAARGLGIVLRSLKEVIELVRANLLG